MRTRTSCGAPAGSAAGSPHRGRAVTYRGCVCAGAAVALIVLAAGCGSSSTTTSPAPSTPSAASTTLAAPKTTTPAPSPPSPAPSGPRSIPPAPPPGTTTPSSGPSLCLTNQLSISDKPASGGLSHAGIVLVFANHGAPCTLTGYPGVDGLRAGAAVVHAERTLNGYLGGAKSTATVTLAAGQSASALLEGLDGPPAGQKCASYTSLLVTPPNDRQSVPLDSRAPLCSPQIHPVVAGGSGSANAHS